MLRSRYGSSGCIVEHHHEGFIIKLIKQHGNVFQRSGRLCVLIQFLILSYHHCQQRGCSKTNTFSAFFLLNNANASLTAHLAPLTTKNKIISIHHILLNYDTYVYIIYKLIRILLNVIVMLYDISATLLPI